MTRREWISHLPACLALANATHLKGQDMRQTIQTAKAAVVAERTFGLHLLRELIDRNAAKNVFISPLSIFLALHMTENGAGGTTRTAMRKALALPSLDAAALNASSAALQSLLKGRDPGALTIANALWADRHHPLAAAFVKQCESVFNAHAASLDFTDPKSAAAMNAWVKTKTNGKIGDVVKYDSVRKAAVVLINAVYFAAKWRSEFSVSETSDAPFHKTGGGTKTGPMMQQTRLTGAYRRGTNFEGAMLYYKESSMFFYDLLPQAGKRRRTRSRPSTLSISPPKTQSSIST